MQPGVRLNEKTGLYPQRMLETLLAYEIGRARRYPNPVTVVYIALRFDELEPSSEILAGAHSLLTNVLHSRLREVDMPGHYQGNYLVIMPFSDSEGAKVAVKRLVEQIQGLKIKHEESDYQFSVCVGVATHPGGDGLTAEELLSRASSALWEAHRQGPHSIVLFEEMNSRLM